MNKGIFYILGLWLTTMPCYAVEVNVSNDATKLDFGKAVLLGNTATVGVDYTGRPLWLRAMKASTSNIPAAGTITFSSNMEDGFDRLVIKPSVTSSSEFPLSGGASCDRMK